MAAAACAAECGVRVGIVDDNFSLGGQIWRGDTGEHKKEQEIDDQQNTEASKWAERARLAGVTVLCGFRVVHQPEAGLLLAETLDGFCELAYTKLVLATGARERFLPFPGWTLPNVMGAGGLQAMVKCGLPIRGKRVIVAGTGPLLLAVAAYLRKRGAEIDWHLYEASNRLGGIIETTRHSTSEGEFTLEGGPDGWVSEKPWARELAIDRKSVV